MPFITLERRYAIVAGTLKDWQPGDRCYVYYQMMVNTWKKKPGWTTADEIYRMMRMSSLPEADKAAQELAWQVFFQLYVMEYEKVKREENGDI